MPHTFSDDEMRVLRDVALGWPGVGTWRGLIKGCCPHMTEEQTVAFLSALGAHEGIGEYEVSIPASERQQYAEALRSLVEDRETYLLSVYGDPSENEVVQTCRRLLDLLAGGA